MVASGLSRQRISSPPPSTDASAQLGLRHPERDKAHQLLHASTALQNPAGCIAITALFSSVFLLPQALAEGTRAKRCFWFCRMPQLSHGRQSGNLNRGMHPPSSNLLSTGLMVLAPINCKPSPSWASQAAVALEHLNALSRSIVSLTPHHNPSGRRRERCPRSRPFSGSQRNSSARRHQLVLAVPRCHVPRVLKSDPSLKGQEQRDNAQREGNKSPLTP